MVMVATETKGNEKIKIVYLSLANYLDIGFPKQVFVLFDEE